MTEKINKGCEFQSDCIEYKDISYLKVMPICAIYELSIACHHKVDRCKYYKLYKQLIRLEQENKELKEETLQWKQIKDMANNNKYKSVLEEIREIATRISKATIDIYQYGGDVPTEEAKAAMKILNKINEVLNES